jgi:hypothetical protein
VLCQKTALYDKILDLFQRHGILTNERVKYLLEKDFEIVVSLRTIQRHTAALVKDKELIPTTPKGRSQSYKIKSEQLSNPTGLSQFFQDKIWAELFQIRELLHKNYSPPFDAGWVESYIRLTSLVKLLPLEIKKEIIPELSKNDKISESEIDEIKNRLKNEPVHLLSEQNEFQIEVDSLMEKRVEAIIDKIATLLHQYNKPTQ